MNVTPTLNLINPSEDMASDVIPDLATNFSTIDTAFKNLQDRIGVVETYSAKPPVIEEFQATEGQTVFQLTKTTFNVGAGEVAVEIDGVPQDTGEGFTETGIDTITLTEGVSAGTDVKIIVSKVSLSLSEKLKDMDTSITSSTKKLTGVWVNVQEYGAKGDGIADDTAAFQAAIDYLKSLGGGRLFIPKTAAFYLLKDGVTLCDNLYIFSNGAVLKKTALCNTYYVFQSLSGANTGYGSGANNVIIEGLQVAGSFADSRGASFTLHHAKNITIRNCTFVEAVISGHPIDLGGCTDVLVENCWFFGFKPVTDREYVEAIQIDHSTAEGLGILGETFDGLPTKNVTVQNCKFLPLTVSGTKYNAPNPLGSHSRVDGQWFTNIKFLNNYVEDGPTFGTSTFALGWLHFYHVDGLEIAGNTFLNTDGHDSRVLGLYTIDTAILMSDVNIAAPTKQPYTSLPCKNVTFRNNKIKGFSHQNSSRLIYLQGKLYSATKYFVENIRFYDNDVADCFVYATTYNACSDIVYAEYVKGLRIYGNKAKNVKRLVYATESAKIRVRDNDIQSAYWVPVLIESSNDVKEIGNSFDGCGSAIYHNAVNNLLIEGNTVVNDITSAFSSYVSIFALKTCTQFFIKNNYLEGVSGTGYRSINCYTTSDKGKITDNWITNFAAVLISADSTNITVS